MKYSEKNKPLVCMQTQSTCYKGTRKMEVKGVLWHDTGANNPNLKRYVQPSDNASDRAEWLKKLGTNQYANDWNHIEHQAGLNCWIGKLADGTVTTVQTMPWDYRPWGCGSGSKGSCNTGWIQFEICEDGKDDADYFNKAYKEACEITAYLCRLYGIDPNGTVKVNGVTVPTILCHQDSYKLGLGSNHSDIYDWFPKYGKSMETARADVAKLLAEGGVSTKPAEEAAASVQTAPAGETAAAIRARVVKRAQSYLGCKESDGSHRKIIDLYNSHKPLAVGYAVTYTDAWCDTFVSAVAIAEGLTDIIPTECGCERHIALFKKIGRWVEDDAYVPSPGDIIFYDWQDSGSGDNIGHSDHVGYVVSVSRNTITVIEGNKSDAVGYREIAVNGRYIRGYAVPDYESKATASAPTSAPAAVDDNEKAIWDRLYAAIGNVYGVGGVMGNFYAESSLHANNLQNSYEKKLGMTDEEYTAAVDSGSYENFVHDSAGYGLYQATFWSIKESLLNYAKSVGKSIGDRDMQVDHFLKLMKEEYTAIWKVLTTASTVREASDAVLLKFERPADQSEAVQVKRAGYGQVYVDKYASAPTPANTVYYRVRKSWVDKASQIGAYTVLQNAKNAVDANPGYAAFDESGNQVYPAASAPAAPKSKVPYLVRVSIDDLNIRKGPGTNYSRTGQYTGRGVFTIVEEASGQGSTVGWGRLKSGAGWISLDYTTAI